MLDELQQKLQPAARRARQQAFVEARKFIVRAADAGGASAITKKSFPKKPLPGGVRVDIEISAGCAFVRSQPPPTPTGSNE